MRAIVLTSDNLRNAYFAETVASQFNLLARISMSYRQHCTGSVVLVQRELEFHPV